MGEVEKLPDRDSAWVEEKKLRKYLLNLDHPEGGPKARFFLNRGFTLTGWQELGKAIVAQGVANSVVEVKDAKFGRRFIVECSCPTPDGSNPCIRSVWEVSPNDTRPRLITAHPLRV